MNFALYTNKRNAISANAATALATSCHPQRSSIRYATVAAQPGSFLCKNSATPKALAVAQKASDGQ
jgi:hypothetical protein